MPNTTENVSVVVRVRPMMSRERDHGNEELVRCVSDSSIQVIDPSQQRGRTQTAMAYQFEHGFGEECTQEQLFEECGVILTNLHPALGYVRIVYKSLLCTHLS